MTGQFSTRDAVKTAKCENTVFMYRRTFTQSLLTLALGAGGRGLARERKLEAPNADELDWLGPGGLTDVAGIKVGHFTSKQRPTGCTVVLCEAGAVAGVDVRGSAPGTRETDLLNPVNTVEQVQAIVLSGGSAFGLDTATGVMRYLEEHGLGFKVGAAGVVPIVPAAVLFDLTIGDAKIRPNAESGYQACVAAVSGTIAQGNVGAGAGATVGKLFGQGSAMKSGLGAASAKVGDTGIVVAALVAVNALGDVINPKSGRIVAGARTQDGHGLRDSMAEIMRGYQVTSQIGANTTIGVVATNAAFGKVQMTKIAQMAHDGLARSINPVHTLFDGDTIFAISTGTLKKTGSHGHIGAIAAEVMAQAVVRAVTHAQGIPGLPAYRDMAAR
ncbi:MAG TPA: P1 family peptidase [Candidatus Angelobacter sp.]|nr:P1 family peptidase [Candidatus Angelobacter sp.]